MSCSVSCARCQSRKVKMIRLDAEVELHEWRCQNCGESCEHPNKSKASLPMLDTTIGLAVLVTVMCLLFCGLV